MYNGENHLVAGMPGAWDEYLASLRTYTISCSFCQRDRDETTVTYLHESGHTICEGCIQSMTLDLAEAKYEIHDHPENQEMVEEVLTLKNLNDGKK